MTNTPSEIICDLTKIDGFPPHGENRSVLTILGSDARLDVFFDSANDSDEECVTFQFEGASQVTRTCFPGIGPRSLAVVQASFSALIQIRRSEIAAEWTAYWRVRKMPATFHFQIVLPEENSKYDIFARDVVVHGKQEPHTPSH